MKEKELKFLTPSKLLSRLSILLTKIKDGNISNKLKKIKSDKYYIFCVNTIKSPKKFTTI